MKKITIDLLVSFSLLFSLLFSLSFSMPGFAEPMDPRCGLPESLCELQLEFDAADRDLNNVYQAIIKKIQNNAFSDSLVDKSDLSNSLRTSQRAWLIFRDENCEAYYTLFSGGSDRNQTRMTCLIKMTQQRTDYLATTYATF